MFKQNNFQSGGFLQNWFINMALFNSQCLFRVEYVTFLINLVNQTNFKESFCFCNETVTPTLHDLYRYLGYVDRKGISNGIMFVNVTITVVQRSLYKTKELLYILNIYFKV